MSGQLRSIKKRIRSVENTKKITRAMEMVASAKLNRFQNLMKQAEPYAKSLQDLTEQLAADYLGKTKKKSASSYEVKIFPHRLLEQRSEQKVGLVIITSDTGLCGSFNAQVSDGARKFIAAQKNLPLLIGIGKTGVAMLERAGYRFHRSFIKTRMADIENMLKELIQEIAFVFSGHLVDAVYVLYHRNLSLCTYKEVTEKILPIEIVQEKAISSEGTSVYIYEPSPDEIFTKLIPASFEANIRMIYFRACISEQIARMNAMHLATKNAEEMLDSLVLLRNKMRQAAITNELIEIVSGSQALEIP